MGNDVYPCPQTSRSYLFIYASMDDILHNGNKNSYKFRNRFYYIINYLVLFINDKTG